MPAPDYPIAQITDRIAQAINEELRPCAREKFWVTHYGANDIHPKYLVYWIVVMSDLEKRRLQTDSALMDRLRALLVQHGYPAEGREEVHIGFESHETVDRESSGNFYHHWK
jgi:hypothetical protein